MDRRDRGAHRRRAGRAHAVPSPTCRMARIPPDRFTELALASPAVHRRIMRQISPVMTRLTRDRAEPRAARLARHDGGRARARAQQPGRRRQARGVATSSTRWRPSAARSARSSRRASSARTPSGSCALHDEALERGGRGRRSARSTRPTPRTRCSSASRTSACPRPWRLAEPLAGAGLDGDWLRAGRGARRPGDRARAALGRRLADRAQPRRASCSTRPSGWARWSARSRPTPTWTAAASSRPTSTKGSRARWSILGHKLKHTKIAVVRDYDRALPKLTVRGSELNQVWTNLHRQRDRRARRARHDHGPHAPRRRLRPGRHRRRRPRHPARTPGARPRAVLHDQGRRQRDRPGPRHRAADRRGGPRRQHLVRHLDAGTTFHVRLPLRAAER